MANHKVNCKSGVPPGHAAQPHSLASAMARNCGQHVGKRLMVPFATEGESYDGTHCRIRWCNSPRTLTTTTNKLLQYDIQLHKFPQPFATPPPHTMGRQAVVISAAVYRRGLGAVLCPIPCNSPTCRNSPYLDISTQTVAADFISLLPHLFALLTFLWILLCAIKSPPPLYTRASLIKPPTHTSVLRTTHFLFFFFFFFSSLKLHKQKIFFFNPN